MKTRGSVTICRLHLLCSALRETLLKLSSNHLAVSQHASCSCRVDVGEAAAGAVQYKYASVRVNFQAASKGISLVHDRKAAA
jgi:hypothetical protein